MRKGENPERFRRNLINLSTGTVHASGSVWKRYGPICRNIRSFRENDAYVETDNKITCKTCIYMRLQ